MAMRRVLSDSTVVSVRMSAGEKRQLDELIGAVEKRSGLAERDDFSLVVPAQSAVA